MGIILYSIIKVGLKNYDCAKLLHQIADFFFFRFLKKIHTYIYIYIYVYIIFLLL